MTPYLYDQEKKQLIDTIVNSITLETEAFTRLCQQFAAEYLGTVALEDLYPRATSYWRGLVINYWNFIKDRKPKETKIRIYNPELSKDGWESPYTVIEVAHDEIPFLIDSLHMEIQRLGYISHLIIHSGGIKFKRDENHHITEILKANTHESQTEGFHAEADLLIEIDKQTDAAILEELKQHCERILTDVKIINRDWTPMRQKVREIIEEMETYPSCTNTSDLEESREFLKWLEAHHFTFLGIRDYAWDHGKMGGESISGTGLGLLSDEHESHASFSKLLSMNEETQNLRDSAGILLLSKTDTLSTVHRPVYMDYIGVKRFNAKGEVIGERRIVGLFTSAAYNASPRQIPFLRHKISHVMSQSHLNPKAHTGKILLNILETLPRDDLFQGTPEEILSIAMGVYHMQERRRVRLFARKDMYGRFISCLVYLPKDRYSTSLGRKITEILGHRFETNNVSYTTRFSDSVLAQLHFTVRLNGPLSEKHFSNTYFTEIEKQFIEICRLWADELKSLLFKAHGENLGRTLFNEYENAFSAGYQDAFTPATAVNDIKHMTQLSTNRQIQMQLYRPNPEALSIRFKLYRFNTTIPLSDVLPILENLGLRVISERPFQVRIANGKKVWINDFGFSIQSNIAWNDEKIQQVFKEAFENIWFKRAENDGFNRLVTAAELSWREVSVLRAYAKYFKQIQLPYSQELIETTFSAYPNIAKNLIELFMTRFCVTSTDSIEERLTATAAIKATIENSLDAVTSLDQDKILRRYIDVILATVRTNYFQLKKDGKLRSYLSFKFDSKKIPDMPLPLPLYEVFVYSPRFEAIHLRCAKVARGGLRWSDRRDDFRTEILGLMKAQQVKNAVIVPSGAKGGFYPKNLPTTGGREAMLAEGIACYKRFIRALLDITDNYQGDKVIRPLQVFCHDDEDPYLVVAADKGTATFSDIANKISQDHNFWLGDAFASGGSAGYDHKKMGITARGAWESVKRHFHELGHNTQTTDFTVVGVGDMAGDVFGNGMLLSEHICLLAAFNHMHIFVDPNPDAKTTFIERKRLFELPTSTWADYNLELISKGGGIFNRNAKFITLSEEIKTRFNLTQSVIEPNAFIKILLTSHVDLLWNGGIGTYVKASTETHTDVGDRANDALRVNGRELNCRVVGEGGNLGCTQLGRIEYSLKGGLIYTDFIDNSAGVDCSDNEVNIKILLNEIVQKGEFTESERNELLAQMTDEVSRLVLNDNYQQIRAISLAANQGFRSVNLHTRYMQDLIGKGLLNRELEFLPDEKALMERKLHEQGLTRSEMAILFAYTKNILRDRILESHLPEDPFLNRVLMEAFPKPLQENYAEPMKNHRLKREIIATKLSSNIVDKMGFTFIYRTEDETGASIESIVRAFVAGWHIFDMDTLWQEIQSLDGVVATQAQLSIMMLCIRWMRRVARWLVRTRHDHTDIGSLINAYAPHVQALKQLLPGCLNEAERARFDASREQYLSDAVPEALSNKLAMIPALFSALDIVEASYELNGNISDAANVYFRVGSYLELTWLRDEVIIHTAENHWEALSREVLRDDLDKQQRLLTIGILSHIPEKMELNRCLLLWTESYAELVARWQTIMAELKNTKVLTYTMFFMAVRELLELTSIALKNQQRLTHGL